MRAEMTEILERVRVVLVATSHPGNIGGAARAMRTMGLSRLVLVRPKSFPDAEADARAAGAGDVLDKAVVVATLADALAGCRIAFGCSARARGVALRELSPAQAASELIACAGGGEEVALVFGNERVGLTNEEIQQCHAAVRIDTDPGFSSLNLAAAVQVLAYELRNAAVGGVKEAPGVAAVDPAATADELEGYFAHLQQALADIDFFKGRAPDTIMRRFRRMFFRATLTRREVLILRGVLSDAQRMARLAGKTVSE